MSDEKSKLSEKDIRYNEKIENLTQNICYLQTESGELDGNYFGRLKVKALEEKDERAIEEFNKLRKIYKLSKEEKDNLLKEDENGNLNILKYDLTPESYIYVLSYYLDYDNFKSLFKVTNVNGNKTLRIKTLGIDDYEISRMLSDTKNKYLRNAILLLDIENGEDVSALNFLFSDNQDKKAVLAASRIPNIKIVKNIINGKYGNLGEDTLNMILLNCNLKLLNELLKDKNLFEEKEKLYEELLNKALVLNEITNIDRKIKGNNTFKIPHGMTVGVELEVIGPLCYSLYGELIGGFKGKEDITIKDEKCKTVEIVSPILNNGNVNDVIYLAEKLQAIGCYTNKTCGGHIHIGANYLTIKENGEVDVDASVAAWQSFLELWKSTEEIMYKITNKEGEKHRGIRFTKPITPKIENFLKDRLDAGCRKNLLKFKKELKATQLENEPIITERNFSINFDNLDNDKNTIEFRLPNGTIEKEELIANITLFSKLVATSRKLGTIENKKNKKEELTKEEVQMLILKQEITENNQMKEEEKFSKLMSLMFSNDENIEIYRKRYYSSKFNLETEMNELNSERIENKGKYGQSLTRNELRILHALNKTEREERDVIAEEREIRYDENDYNELNDYCEKEMPNKFNEVMSKIKSFFKSIKERVLDRER